MEQETQIDKSIHCDYCDNIIERQFRFTDWNDERNDSYGNWEECLGWFNQAVKNNEQGRFSIYAVTICPECEKLLEDEGVLFNKNCEEYNDI